MGFLIHMAHTWHTHGTHMAHAWHPYGTHMAHTWHTHGTHMAHTWHPYGTHMAHAWHPYGIHMAHTWHPYGTHMAHTWHPYGIHKYHLLAGLRPPTQTCLLVGNPGAMMDASCSLPTALAITQAECEGRESCRVSFWPDPCEGISKWFEATFSCDPPPP